MNAVAPTPVVSIDGRTVTVSFVLPFVVGDECITPYGFEKTAVGRIPEITVLLEENLSKVRIQCFGAWYTKNHTQNHGLDQFLPDEEAFLNYWLSEKNRDFFEDRLSNLKHSFKGQPKAIARLVQRQVELLQAEADREKAKLGASIVESTQKVALLEAAIAKAKGGAA